MRKTESLLKLEELHLNSPNTHITKDKQEVLHYLAKHANDKISMRTEKGLNWKCPFYYMIPGQDLIDPAVRHLSEGYTLIFSESIDYII